jgi:hypothetical protein
MCGMLHNQPTGPISFKVHLTGDIYMKFLQNELSDLLEYVPLETRLCMHFVLNGASPHFNRALKAYRDRRFWWIVLGGPQHCLCRSREISILDFYPWAHMKDVVYQQKVGTREIYCFVAFGLLQPV